MAWFLEPTYVLVTENMLVDRSMPLQSTVFKYDLLAGWNNYNVHDGGE